VFNISLLHPAILTPEVGSEGGNRLIMGYFRGLIWLGSRLKGGWVVEGW